MNFWKSCDLMLSPRMEKNNPNRRLIGETLIAETTESRSRLSQLYCIGVCPRGPHVLRTTG